MSEFQLTECQCCGNRLGSNFKEKEDGYVCKCCGVWFRYENNEEKRGCADGYKHLRKYQFEDACEEFETVICNNPGSIDARWGLLLARFGIVFIKGFFDNVTEPIYCFPEYDELEEGVFRKQREYGEMLDILDKTAQNGDSDGAKKALELRYFYEKKAKEIDRAIKKFSECKRNTERDVFICVKISAATEKNPALPGETEDCAVAKNLYAELEKRGISTFFSYKTLKNEVNSDDLIWLNLVKSKKMILIGSQRDYLESAWVKSEWKRWKFLERLEDLYVLVLKHNHEYPKEVLPHELRKSQIYTLDTYDKLISDICGEEPAKESDEDKIRAAVEAEIRKRMEAEEKAAAEQARKAQEAAAAEQARIAREAAAAEQARKAQEAAAAEQARKAREAAAAEQARKAQEAAAAEQARIAQEAAAKPASTEDGKIIYNDGRVEILRYGMKEISEKAYYNNKDIVSIVFPSSITCIKKFSFSLCSNLKSISFSEGLVSLESSAFSFCTKLESIVLPASLESMGNEVFSACYNVKNVFIPENVKTIGTNPFAHCKAAVSISPKNKYFKLINHFLLSSDGKKLLFFVPNGENDVSCSVPEGVVDIAENAFYGNKILSDISLPSTLTSIGLCAFAHCTKLKSIELPQSVKNIGGQAFRGCQALESISVPEGIQKLDYCMFKECLSLYKVSLPRSLTVIAWDAFEKCPLKDVYYSGSRSDWKNIKIEKGNAKLNGLMGKANIHFR